MSVLRLRRRSKSKAKRSEQRAAEYLQAAAGGAWVTEISPEQTRFFFWPQPVVNIFCLESWFAVLFVPHSIRHFFGAKHFRYFSSQFGFGCLSEPVLSSPVAVRSRNSPFLERPIRNRCTIYPFLFLRRDCFSATERKYSVKSDGNNHEITCRKQKSP